MKEDSGLVFAFNDNFPAYDHSIPITKSAVHHGYLAIGLANGNIRIYKLQEEQPLLVAHIESDIDNHVTVLKGASDYLFASFADGTVAKYELCTGILVNLTKLPFVATGFNCHLVLQGGLRSALLIWGRSTKVSVLDLHTLETLIEIDSQFPNWPIATPLFSDHLLLVSRGGHSSQWRLRLDDVPSKNAKEVEQEELADLLAEPNSEHNHFHKVDLIIAVLLISDTSWVVVQRHGWTTFNWKNNRLVREVGMCMLKPIINAFHLNENMFGLVQSNGEVVVVVNDQMVSINNRHENIIGAVHFYHKRIWAVIEKDTELNLAYADFDPKKSVSEVTWSNRQITLEHNTFTRTFITNINSLESGIIVCKASENVFSIFRGPSSWLNKQPDETYEINALKNDVLTALDIRNIENGIIIIGTRKGNVMMLHIWNKQFDILNSATPFTSPVTKFLRPKSSDIPEISNLIVVLSLTGAASVIDITGAMSPVTLPGSHTEIQMVSLTTSQQTTEPIITFWYENNKQKTWNIITMDETQPPDYATEDRFICADSPKTTDRTFAILNRQPNVYSALLIKSDNIKGQSIKQALAKRIANGEFGIVSAYAKRSILSTTFINYHNSSRFAVSKRLTCRLACALFLCEGQDSFKQFIRDHIEYLDIEMISDFIVNHTRANSKLRSSSCMLLTSVIGRVNEIDEANFKTEIETVWIERLPLESPGEKFDEINMKALCVVSEFIDCLYANNDHKELFFRLAKSTIDSLIICMSTDSPKRSANLAFELTGSHWNIWQKFCNPVTVVDVLLINLYQRGFSKLERSQFTNFEELPQNIGVCLSCARNMARFNITLMISALIARIGDEVRSLDIRITATKLLSILILTQDSETVIGPSHLPLILSRVVRCLDHAEPAVRDIPASANASLIAEATQLLSIMLGQYSDYMSFHRNQQRLAVAIIPEDVSSTYRGLLGVIYDLRTGTLVSSLGTNYVTENSSSKIQGVSPGSVLHKMEFSEDGKRLAGVIENMKDWGTTKFKTTTSVTVAIWKISMGFFSMLQNINVRHSVSTYDSGHSDNGAILYPVSIIHAPVKAKEYFKFKWIASDKIAISGDQETKSMTYSFE